MKKFFDVLSILAIMLALATTAFAKDEVLENAFVKVDKAYIPPLFFTSAMAMGSTVASMNAYKAAWAEFKTNYYDYKPDYANWQTYFDTVDAANLKADGIIKAAFAANNPQLLPPAHDALEVVRETMLELREHNGFSKFITDKQTLFHEPMEAIVLSLKGLTPLQVTEELKAALRAELPLAMKTWSDIEKCPVDAEQWLLTAAQTTAYYGYLVAERTRLEAFQTALDADDNLLIIQTGMALKPVFVESYKIFGSFSLYVR